MREGWLEDLQERRVRALGALLCLGCYHSLWQWSQRGGLFDDAGVRFDLLLPPWVPAWRAELMTSAFVTVGVMWMLGMAALAGMFLMLAGGGGRLPLGLLALSLTGKAFFYTGDFRLWSGLENAHLVLGAAFLLLRPRAAAVRAALALSLVGSGFLQATQGGVTGLAAVQVVAPALWWLVPWSGVGTGLLAALFAVQAVQTSAELVMVPMGCALLAGGAAEPLPRRAWALLVALVVAFLAPGLHHPQLSMNPARTPVHARAFLTRGGIEQRLSVDLALVGPGERRVVVRLASPPEFEDSVLLDPLMDSGQVLINPLFFQEADLALADPYLYRAFGQEFKRRFGGQVSWELQLGPRRENFRI